MNKTYIFGSSGFIGSEIANYFIYKNQKSKNDIILVNKNDCDLLSKNFQKKIDKLIKNNSLIIFCSAIKKQLGDNIENYSKNTHMFTNLLMAIKNKKNLKIIFISSTAVYGEDVAQKKITENSKINIRTFYGCSKYSNEKILENFSMQYSFKYMILRLPLVFGHGDNSLGYGPSLFYNSSINKKDIFIWGDGSEKREFIYLKDIGKIVYKLRNFKENIILNIVSGKSYSYMNIIKILKKILKTEIKLINKKRSKLKVNHFFNNFNIQKYHFNFTSLEKALKDMFLENSNEKK
tara:strand:+ start:208 stop:1083 length:876 start_codon:yes stop_codon:yes gene_type:complete